MVVKQLWTSLDFKALKRLITLCLTNITFVLPTLVATKRCIRIAEKEFGNNHHKNNCSNAFRHACWNYLIITSSIRFLNSENNSLIWAKRITDLHEELFKNSLLEKAMDDHNNAVGRNFYLKHKEITVKEGIAKLKELAQTSIYIRNMDDLRSISEENLIHIVAM